jgi:hypothetical protein
MIEQRAVVLMSFLLAAITGFAHAQDRPVGFQSPSKNIGCQFYTDNGQGMLRCDIMNMETRPRRPADCELEWGDATRRCPCWPMARCGSARGSHADWSKRD